MLASQKLARPEDENSGNEDVEMNVWAYLERYDQERSYPRQGRNRLCGGQDERGETEMIRPYEEKMCIDALVTRCERLTILGIRRGGGRSKKF